VSDKAKPSDHPVKKNMSLNTKLSILALLSIFIVIAINCSSLLRSSIAIRQFLVDPQYENLVLSYESEKELKRSIQGHFLSHSIYIPTEDINIRKTEGDDQEIFKLLAETCGLADIYIWVPIRYRLPLVGEQTLEWCLAKTSKNQRQFQ
jgi:hypothetical protein